MTTTATTNGLHSARFNTVQFDLIRFGCARRASAPGWRQARHAHPCPAPPHRITPHTAQYPARGVIDLTAADRRDAAHGRVRAAQCAFRSA